MREAIHLGCEKCTRRNYHTTKNKKTHTEKFSVKNIVSFVVSILFTKR